MTNIEKKIAIEVNKKYVGNGGIWSVGVGDKNIFVYSKTKLSRNLHEKIAEDAKPFDVIVRKVNAPSVEI